MKTYRPNGRKTAAKGKSRAPRIKSELAPRSKSIMYMGEKTAKHYVKRDIADTRPRPTRQDRAASNGRTTSSIRPTGPVVNGGQA